MLALLVRTESALVAVARLEAGKPAADDTAAVAAPRASGLARLRRALGFFPFFRAFVAIEASLLALAAAIVDALVGGNPATRALVDRAGPDRGDHRGRAPGRDPRVEPPAVTFGCVLLTMGRKPEDLRQALDSLLAQRGVEIDIVVVGNEWEPTGLPDGVRGVGSPVNLGIPAGRNLGVPHTRGELLFFLDDDASLASPGRARGGRAPLRRPTRRSGCCSCASPRATAAPRRATGCRACASGTARARATSPPCGRARWRCGASVFDAVGGWPADFRFVHEGIDLGWRVMDAGHRVAYAGDIVALHPSPTGPPHGYSFYYGARNRVWLARRHLPLPLAVPSTSRGFVLRTLPRLRSRQNAREALRGYRDGLRGPAASGGRCARARCGA